MLKAYKPVLSTKDVYQTSQDTNYQRDQTTGALFLKSGSNVRTILTEQFKSGVFEYNDGTVVGGGSTVLRTVPAGKVLLLMSVSLQISHKAATFGLSGWIRFGGVALLTGYGTDDAGAYGMAKTFTSFIAVPAGSTIAVQADNNLIRATGSYTGFLIDSSEYFPA